MSIRSNITGQLTVPFQGNAHNVPCSFSCWAKFTSAGGGFGAVITMEDSYFNSFPGFLNQSGAVIWTTNAGVNLQVVADGTHWFYCAGSWDGTGTTATGMGLDHNGLWTVQTGAANNGGVGLPSFLIGGQNIDTGSSTNDSDVFYRGVNIWSDVKSTQFLKAQAAQLAPISDVNLWSSLWPEKTISNLGYSSAGRPWSQTVAGFITSSDEPPVPDVIRRRAFSFSTQPVTTSGMIISAAAW